MPHPRRTTALVLQLMLVLAVAACAEEPVADAEGSDVDTAGETLSLGFVVDPAWAQVPVSQELELFEEAGVAVEVTNFASGAEAMEALSGGAVDVVSAADVPTSAAITANPDIRVLAQGAFHGNMRIVADASRGIESFADLAGRKIGTAMGTSAHYMASTYLDQAGVEATLVQVSPPELQTALDGGDVDAAAIFEPYATRISQALEDDAVALQGDPVYTSLVFYNTRTDVLDNKDTEVARMLAALECASALLREDDADAITAVGEATGLEAATLEEVVQGYTYGLKLDDGASDTLTSLVEWAIAEGNLAGDTEVPDYAEHFHYSGLEAAAGIELPTCN